MDRYESNTNINVFQIENRKHFLWFANGNLSGNEVKLYIPLDAQHLQEGANQIFDFISKTSIQHQSKIADKIRNDNIVIRVNNLNDAQTIINFVNSNNYLREGLIKVNPFLSNCNGVGITMDNSYSFNSTLCNIICNFVFHLKQQNALNLLTIENLNIYKGQYR